MMNLNTDRIIRNETSGKRFGRSIIKNIELLDQFSERKLSIQKRDGRCYANNNRETKILMSKTIRIENVCATVEYQDSSSKVKIAEFSNKKSRYSTLELRNETLMGKIEDGSFREN